MISQYTDQTHIDAFKNCSRDAFVAFAGSGCSFIPGIPTWTGFLLALNDIINASVDVKSFTDRDDFYGAASAIYNENPGEFYSGIAELIVEATKTDFIAIHSSIWSFFDRVFTTNYDHCFEAAIVAHNRPLQIKGYDPCTFLYQELPSLNFAQFVAAEKSLAYVHGRAGSKELILRREDYQKYYPTFYPGINSAPSHNLEKFLEQAVDTFSFVFIGFSMDDEDFVRAFETFWERHKEKVRNASSTRPQVSNMNHFIFLLNNQLKDWLSVQDIRKAKLNVDELIDKKIVKYHHDQERLIFHHNIDRAIKKADFSAEAQAMIFSLVQKLEKNRQKLELLKRLNIFDIRLPGEDYNSISRYLDQLMPVRDSSDQVNIQDI